MRLAYSRRRLCVRSVCLSLAAAEIVFLSRAEKSSRFPLRLAGALIVGGAASYALQFIPSGGWWIFLLPLLISAVGCFVCCRIGILYALLFAVISHSLQNSAFCISCIICAAFPSLDFWASEVISLFALALLLAGCWFLFVRNLDYKALFGVKNVKLVAVCLVVLILITVLHSAFNRSTAQLIGRVFLVVCVCLAIFLVFGLSAQVKLTREKEEIEQLLHKQEKLHQMSKENINMINLKCHDLKHRISAIKNGGSGADFTDIDQAVDTYDSFIKTGNEDLDIVLAEKSLYCKKYGIQLSCIIDGEKLGFMSPVDIYALFGNAFDNAIEALKNVPEEKRVISLTVQKNGRFLGIRMENYCETVLQFADGLPITVKQEKNFHGYGMKSISYITEKYGGNLLAEQSGDMFVLGIVFAADNLLK